MQQETQQKMQDGSKISSSLADIMDETPRRVVEFDMDRVDVSRLTVLELLDLCDAAGIESEEMQQALDGGGALKARLLYAIAWVILRRKEPDLTYQEVCQVDLIVSGKPKEVNIGTVKRARKVVAIATVAGTTPREAENLTLAEVGAYAAQVKRRNRARRG